MAHSPRRAADRCPSREDLLLASEGELSSRQTGQVMTHASRCTDCRDYLASMPLQVRRLNELVAQASREAAERQAGHHQLFQQRLTQELQRDEAGKGAGIARFRVPGRRWLPYAAVAPILATSLVFSSRYTETLRADELLKGAVQEQRAKAPTEVQRVQISLKKSAAGAGHTSNATTFTRQLGAAASAASRFDTSVEPLDEEKRMAARMAAMYFDINDPLSAAKFEHWRATRSSKRDLLTESDDGKLRSLTTTTSDGGIWKWIFVVRLADLHPVRQSLSFVDGYELVSEEIEAWKVETPPLTAPVTSHATTTSASGRAGAARAGNETALTAAGVRPLIPKPEPLPAFGLERWRQRTFYGSPAGDSFLPGLVRSVDRLSQAAHALEITSRSAAPSSATLSRDYQTFLAELEMVDDRLNQFLGSSTHQSANRAPADLDKRAPLIAARAEALRRAVRALVLQPDLPIRADIEAGMAEPDELAALRRALDALWSSLVPRS